MPLPDPMLAKPGPLPTGRVWSFEPKWDGYRSVAVRIGPRSPTAHSRLTHLLLQVEGVLTAAGKTPFSGMGSPLSSAWPNPIPSFWSD